MSKRDNQILLCLLGAGLIAGGHRLMDAELGKLGAPHAIGAALLALAVRA
ncbi:MAG: hypothetical protein U0R52_00925 [Solirubrobacterales bacterium]